MSYISWTKIKREIFLAIKKGEYELVLRMIKEHPKVLTAYNTDDESLLHIAAETENIEILKLLIEQGLDVNIGRKNETITHVTPIHNAVEKGSIKTVKWLIEHGADIDTGYGVHATPLILAAGKGNLEIIKLLLESGADINATYYIGEGESKIKFNALKRAEMKGHNDVVRFLRNHGATEINEVEEIKEDTVLTVRDEILQHIKKNWDLLKIH